MLCIVTPILLPSLELFNSSSCKDSVKIIGVKRLTKLVLNEVVKKLGVYFEINLYSYDTKRILSIDT